MSVSVTLKGCMQVSKFLVDLDNYR